VAAALGLAVVVAIAVGVEHFIYRPLAERAGATALLAVFVAALGLTIAGTNLIQLFWGSDTKSFRGIAKKVYRFSDVAVTNYEVYSFISAILLVVVLALLLRYTGLGRAIKATRVNPGLATIIGIDSRIIYLICFGVGTLLGGVNAFWYAHRYSVSFDMGLRPTIYAFVVAFLAGTASSPIRVFVTGVLLGLLEQYVSIFLSLQWQQTAVFVVLMIYLIAKSTELKRLLAIVRPTRPGRPAQPAAAPTT
jgi:branched-subunit amino acid ABC-type transport system permease component